MSKVICIGIVVADLQAKPINKCPQPGTLILARQMEWNTGGCALNTALALQKLGIRAMLIGKVGNDFLGGWILQECARHEVDISQITRAEEMTSTSVVLISSSGERSFIHYPGANGCLSNKDIDYAQFWDADFVYIGGVYGLKELDINLEEIILKIKKTNPRIKIVLDVIHNDDVQNSSMIDNILPYVDFFTPNLKEAQKLSGKDDLVEIGTYFNERGLSNLIITLGGGGSILYQKGQYVMLGAFKTTSVDETGAGDAFVAGLIAGLSRGYDVTQSIELGNAVGALSVTKMGATEGIGSFEETLEFIQEQKSFGGD